MQTQGAAPALKKVTIRRVELHYEERGQGTPVVFVGSLSDDSSGDTAKAKAAYKDFLTLWKDADPDIPVLKQAKAEYAKMQ